MVYFEATSRRDLLFGKYVVLKYVLTHIECDVLCCVINAFCVTVFLGLVVVAVAVGVVDLLVMILVLLVVILLGFVVVGFNSCVDASMCDDVAVAIFFGC